MNLTDGWRADPAILGGATTALAAYVAGIRLRHRRFGARAAGAATAWATGRTAALVAGIGIAVLILESPLDRAADAAFTPHMLQHLLLTDVVAPLLLFAAPLRLALGALPAAPARAIVRAMRGRVARALAYPALTWTLFVVTLYVAHAGPVFERSLEDPGFHEFTHVAFLATSLLFWLPIVATPPTPWTDGPLAYPLRMLYVLIAMPAEAFLGFSIYGAPHVLYAHYRDAGLEDQHAAGELMWIGSGFAMFVAFMLVGVEWGIAERRLGEAENRRLDRADAVAKSLREVRS